MTGKEKTSLDGIATDISWIRKQLEKDCNRIDGLEKDSARAKGYAAGISAIISIVMYWIGKKL